MSEISDTMSLQFLAGPHPLQDETKADKEKTEKVPMYEYADRAIEDFLHTKTRTNQQAIKDAAATQSSQAVNDLAASEAGEHLVQIRKLIADSLSKPVSDENPESVGSALKTLTESLQQALEAIQNTDDMEGSDAHPKVSIGGGFVFDLVCGNISFNISNLHKEKLAQESSNAFIDALKAENNDKIFPTFQDILAEAGKIPTEIVLQKKIIFEKKEAWAILKEIVSKPSMISKAHQNIDSEKALDLLY